jgi:fructose/tagatose bisphosphate aldolase
MSLALIGSHLHLIGADRDMVSSQVPVTVHLDHGSEETAVIDSLELVSKTTADISYSLFGFSYISWTNQGM